MAELQEDSQKGWLCSIRETEMKIDNWIQVQSVLNPQSVAKQPQTPPISTTRNREG